MKYFLPSVTSVTKTYFIIIRMFPNYDTSKKLFFSYRFNKMTFPLRFFFKEITIKTQNDNFNLSIFCYVRLKYTTSDELTKKLPILAVFP